MSIHFRSYIVREVIRTVNCNDLDMAKAMHAEKEWVREDYEPLTEHLFDAIDDKGNVIWSKEDDE